LFETYAVTLVAHDGCWWHFDDGRGFAIVYPLIIGGISIITSIIGTISSTSPGQEDHDRAVTRVSPLRWAGALVLYRSRLNLFKTACSWPGAGNGQSCSVRRNWL